MDQNGCHSDPSRPRRLRPSALRPDQHLARVAIAGPGRRGQHALGTLRALLTDGKVAGPLVHDARIAALCLASGVTERWILNRDFSHFPTLKTRNPLR